MKNAKNAKTQLLAKIADIEALNNTVEVDADAVLEGMQVEMLFAEYEMTGDRKLLEKIYGYPEPSSDEEYEDDEAFFEQQFEDTLADVQKNWATMTEKERVDARGLISDLYKDANGFRPHGMWECWGLV